MPAKFTARISTEGVITHIFNEGIEKKIIFKDNTDYQAFEEFLCEYLSPLEIDNTNKQNFTINGKIYAGKPHLPKNYFGKIELLAYSLLPNHFHIILHQVERGSVERFVRSICTRYSIYFNRKYQRTGSLFNGPYKSVQINTVTELTNLSKYIHTKHNGLYTTGKNEVSYSTFYEYVGLRKTSWVHTQRILSGISQNPSDATREYKEFFSEDLPENDIENLKKVAFDYREIMHQPDTSDQPTNNIDSANNDNLNYQDNYANKQLRTKKYITLSPTRRTPELFVLTVLFMMLFSIGIQSIRSQENIVNANSISQKSTNLSFKNESNINEDYVSPTPSQRDLLNELADVSKLDESDNSSKVLGDSTPTSTNSAETQVSSYYVTNTPSYSPTTLNISKSAVIKIEDDSPIVYIYKYPSIDSEVIGMAIAGERFGYISTLSEWQEIKFNITTIGFVLSKYTYIEELQI